MHKTDAAPSGTAAIEPATGAALLRLVSPARVAGFALYNLWLLSTFYNTFLFLSARDFREALYAHQMLSLGVLALTLGLLPLAVRRADKWVLSLRLSTGAGAALALFTALLAFADLDTPAGTALIVAGGVGTGVSSGALFLGWGRLYADVGARLAMLEIAMTWAAAGLGAALLSLAPPVAATVAVVAGALASALLLRRAALHRPERPRPSRPHRLQRRTWRMFARGLVACVCIGCVMGFSDVLTGFRFMAVPPHYEILLALSCTTATAVVAAVVLRSRHDFMTRTYRVVTMLLTFGCLLTPFVAQTNTLSNVVVFGAYTAFVIMLSVVCVDVSNYFDQPATRTFGMAFCALYAGELLGNGLGHLITDAMHANVASLAAVTLVLTCAVVFVNQFLFTEKDLTETSLGEMTDDDAEDAFGEGRVPRAADTEDALAGATVARAALDDERRIACITALFVERYGLTPREADVLPLVIKGRTIARIQEELHISQGTVSTHTRHIYQKAGVRNRQALLDAIEEIPAADLARAYEETAG